MRNKQFGYRYRKIRQHTEKVNRIASIVFWTIIILGIATFALFSRKAESETINRPVATVVAVKQQSTTNTSKVAPKAKTSLTKPFVGSVENQIREIAEETIGRYLKTWEVVHHKNEIKTDNRPENLQVMMRDEHARIHLTKKLK